MAMLMLAEVAQCDGLRLILIGARRERARCCPLAGCVACGLFGCWRWTATN
jgi:hypothetical protein